MKKFTLLLSAMLLACTTNLWAGDVVVYQLNTASDKTPIATKTDTYSSISSTDCNSAAKDSEVSSAKWKVTLGANINSAPRGLWLGSNKNADNYKNETLGNGSFTEATAIATAVGAKTSDTYYTALISETELPNISKVNVSCNSFGNKTPTKIWLLASENNGTTWKIAAIATDVKTDSTFTFDTPIASARYALVYYYPDKFFSVKVPVLTFYKTVSDAKTVSVAVAEGQEEMGSVAMSYKANSDATEWTAATEPVEIAGEGAEEFQFVATPADGYKFAGWTTTGDITLNSTTAATTEGNSAKETSVVTANFERDATLTSLAISGTATKLNYFVGDTFNPAGLVVTATYSDGEEDDVTDQVSWAFDPETFDEAGTASVGVTANIDAIYSETFTVNDIVVVDVDKYALVTNSTLLADGQHIIIANADATYALSTTQNSTNRGAVAITANDGIIVPSEAVQIITLDSIMVEDAIKWELRVAADSFLYAASTSSNHLKTRKGNSDDTKGQWTISIDSKGVATVKAPGTARNWMRYNSNNGTPLFSCYTNGQEDIAIYARQYTVKVVSNDENMGTVSGDGKYFENNVAELVATPKAGYKLTGWSNDSQLTKNEQSLVVTENITITAYFAKGETAIDNAAVETPAVKTIENGQLVILRDGVKYNAMGVRLQ